MNDYVARIKSVMERSRLKQRQVAALMGVKESTLSNYLNSNRGMKVETVVQICDALEPFTGDVKFYVITGQQPEEHLKAFNINSKYIYKGDVVAKFQDFLLKMNSLREIVVIGDLQKITEAFALSLIGGETSETTQKRNGA